MLLYKMINLTNLANKDLKMFAKARKVDGYENFLTTAATAFYKVPSSSTPASRPAPLT